MASPEVLDPAAVTQDVTETRHGTVHVPCPFDVQVDRVAAFLNAELIDHPVYDGLELQWFDDRRHGTGMLAFLSRRADRTVDYYVAPDLTLAPEDLTLGAGTGAWRVVDFDAARLAVTLEGVDAEVRFTDRDGRRVELRVDDRAARTSRRGSLLAPVSDGIDRPTSLLLVYVHGFDLARRAGPPPSIRIDGVPASTGHLPGRWLHRRHLVKYGAPLTVATVCGRPRGSARLVDPGAPGDVTLGTDGRSIAAVAARRDGGAVELRLTPPLPDLAVLEVGHLRTGTWEVAVDDVTVTGGTWHALRRPGDRVELGLDVTDPWQPTAGQPLLVRAVTRVVPTFRRWPTTYRWRASVVLGDPPTIEGAWERVDRDPSEPYRRWTGHGAAGTTVR